MANPSFPPHFLDPLAPDIEGPPSLSGWVSRDAKSGVTLDSYLSGLHQPGEKGVIERARAGAVAMRRLGPHAPM